MHYKAPTARLLFTVLCTIAIVLQTTAQSSQPVLYQQNSEVNNLMVQFEADRGVLNRFYFVESSPEKRERLKKCYDGYMEQLGQLKWESLPVGSKVDYILFKRNIESQLYLLETEEKEVNQLTKWFPFAASIYNIEKSRRRGTQPDAQKLAFEMNILAKDIDKATKQLEKEPAIDIFLTRRAQSVVAGLQTALRSVNDFYTGYDPMYTWWMQEPYKKLDATLSAYARAWQQKQK
jgi:hypothetical protein